jgi:hypothetical protein
VEWLMKKYVIYFGVMYAGLVLVWWFVHTDKPFNDLLIFELQKEKTDQEKKADGIVKAKKFLALLSDKSYYWQIFEDSDLSWINLPKANLSGVYLQFANLTKANLTGVDLTGVAVNNTIFCKTKTPWGLDNSGCK